MFSKGFLLRVFIVQKKGLSYSYIVLLTLFQMTNFRLSKTETVCGQQFQIE